MGLAGDAVVSYRGVDTDAKSVPDLNDLLPWWAPAGLVATLAFLGFLALVVRFSESKQERKRFGFVVGVVQPLTTSLAAWLLDDAPATRSPRRWFGRGLRPWS